MSRRWIRLALLCACSVLVSPLEGSAQTPAVPLELRPVPMAPVSPTDSVALLAELVNTASTRLDGVTIWGAGYSFPTDQYELSMFDGLRPPDVLRGVSLAPGARVRFILSSLYPKKTTKPGTYAMSNLRLDVQLAQGTRFSLTPIGGFALQVSEQAQPFAARALAPDELPANLERIPDSIEPRALVQESDAIALVDVLGVQTLTDASLLTARVLEPIRGTELDQQLAVRAPYAMGCRWRIAAGHYLAFLKREAGSFVPLDCRGGLLPVSGASAEWSSGFLPWRKVQVTTFSSNPFVREVVQELRDVQRQLDAAAPKPAPAPAPSGAPQTPLAPPNAFRNAPREVRAFLHSQGCSVPQPWAGPEEPLANLISAELAAPGQRDWAVLCSRSGVSSILVLWGGPVRCESPLPQTERGDGECPAAGPGAPEVPAGSCRSLEPLGADAIRAMSFAASRAEDELAGPAHDALGESLGPRIRATHYCDGGRWRRMLSSR